MLRKTTRLEAFVLAQALTGSVPANQGHKDGAHGSMTGPVKVTSVTPWPCLNYEVLSDRSGTQGTSQQMIFKSAKDPRFVPRHSLSSQSYLHFEWWLGCTPPLLLRGCSALGPGRLSCRTRVSRALFDDISCGKTL